MWLTGYLGVGGNRREKERWFFWDTQKAAELQAENTMKSRKWQEQARPLTEDGVIA